MKNHIKEYLIHCDNLKENIHFFNVDSTFCFDTESCFVSEEIKKMYEEKNKRFKNTKITHKGDAVKVYAWALSNTTNDYVLYGESLDQFFNSIETILYSRVNLNQKLSENKVKNIRKQLKMRIFVHNLAWDIEFVKYYLLRNGYDYYNSKVKDRKKVIERHSPHSFNITENDNIVYGANVNFKEKIVKYRKKIKGEFFIVSEEIFPDIEFLDSFKIMTNKLDTIAKKVIHIDDKFHKLGNQYDYDAIRPDGHKLTELERMYLYNDVYILKEFFRQFYNSIDTRQTTASSIAFEKFIQGKYGHDKPYKQFLEDYPDLYPYTNIINIIKNSYSGGWTQVNRFFKGKHLKGINGTSIDINSSYPAVVRNMPLPYGEPTLYKGYHKCKPNELNILVIEFDKFYNKHSNNEIGVIQCGFNNTEVFNRLGTEYIATNVIDGKAKGTNAKSLGHRYRLYMWEFELENILENTVFEDYKVIETLTFKSNIGHFAEVVDEYTEKKIQGKKLGNNALTNFAKLVLNSFYGKLASNPKREERRIILKNGLCKNENTEIVYDADKKYYPAFASAVTAWARCNLRNILYKLSINEQGEYENHVMYFDTDSLYTNLPKEKVIEKLGVYAEYEDIKDENGKVIDTKMVKVLNEEGILDPYILGKWDIEKTYYEFKAIASKKYIVKSHDGKITCKCAGLPEEVRNEQTFDSFYMGATFSGKKVKTKVPGGYVLLEGDYKLKDNIFGGF